MFSPVYQTRRRAGPLFNGMPYSIASRYARRRPRLKKDPLRAAARFAFVGKAITEVMAISTGTDRFVTVLYEPKAAAHHSPKSEDSGRKPVQKFSNRIFTHTPAPGRMNEAALESLGARERRGGSETEVLSPPGRDC